VNWTKIIITAVGKGLIFGVKRLQKPKPLKLRDEVPGEEIVAQWNTQYRNQDWWLDFPPGLLILTTHRLAFLRQGNQGSTKELHFPLQYITNVASYLSRFSSGVEFVHNGRKYHFSVADRSAVCSAIQQACVQLPPPENRLEMRPKKKALMGCFGVVLMSPILLACGHTLIKTQWKTVAHDRTSVGAPVTRR
jgi:hypothetical protein